MCLLAGIFAAPATAAPQVLMPGVTYDKRLTFTRFGPMRLHVLTAPKPTGPLYKLQPVLSNGAVIGRERVTTMQRRAEQSATTAGVNADRFTWADGIPSSGLIQDGVLKTTPHPKRSMVGVDSAGNLHVDRVTMRATWQGAGPRRPVHLINRPPGPNGTTLYTPAYGAATPATSGVVEAVLSPFPGATPNTDLVGFVTESRRGGTPIPPGGAVLVAKGSQGQRLAVEAAAGQMVTVRLVLTPDWRGVTEGVGGGPLIVRGGKAVFNALEDFGRDLNRREPRTAIGQRADGRIVMVVVDGRRPGYSAGLTNFELAQTMIRLGAVTASALDSGGSSTMAFESQLLNRPSDRGGERMIADSLLVFYYGVYTPAPELSFSPNADGAGDRQTLSYKIVRPSSVTATLVGPGGAGRTIDEGNRRPGLYKFDWTGKQSGTPEPEGRWRFQVSAVDNQGQQSTADRSFTLNNTLGFLTVNPLRATVRRKRGGRITLGFQLTRPARVSISITSKTGQLLRVVRNAQAPAGKVLAIWDGRYPNKRVVFSGTYVVRVTATNAVGKAELARSLRVRRR
ncbi:MAG TPA: phosphodiester glycosidase family protein [Gaiellaceae bacterium]|jgi:flagellar hook assembly protein FlgD|nr:phosphodiester glycosidase family protein [Gaiellaceae bacterium]